MKLNAIPEDNKNLPLTSLVDVVFILLFFFMAISGAAAITDVPLVSELSSQTTPAEGPASKLLLSQKGQFFDADGRVSLSELSIHGSKVFHLFAESDVSVETLLQAMQQLADANISVQLSTDNQTPAE